MSFKPTGRATAAGDVTRAIGEKMRRRETVSSRSPSPFGLYANAVSPRTIHGTLLKFAKGDWVAGEDGGRQSPRAPSSPSLHE